MPRRVLVMIVVAIMVGVIVELYVLVRSDPPVVSPAPSPPARVTATPRADAEVAVHSPPLDANTARHDREALLARIREPRPGHEPWDDPGIELLRALGIRAASTADLGCYMAGCIATFTFASMDAYVNEIAAWQAQPAYRAWTGGKQLTPPDQLDDGSVIVAVVLGRPD